MLDHNRLNEFCPNAEVTYSFDYGLTREDGVNARNQLKEQINNLLEQGE